MAASPTPPRLLPSGDSAITVEFSRNIDDAANQRVLALDRAIARKMEPRAATPPRRLEAIRALSGAGVPVIVMVAPIVPALYNKPKTVDDIINHTVGRLLDFFDIETKLVKRWEGGPAED